jgi:uncharacterized membrane protein
MEEEPLDQELSDQEKVLLVFGYLGPLALVSLLTSRREFVKWHAKQGLVLSAILALLYPVLSLVHFVMDGIWSVFGRLVEVAVWMIVLGFFVAMLVCIVRALEGERFKMPIVGDLADRL